MSVSPLVILIRSISYTGTTWLNAVLGSQEQSLAVGPPDRVWQLAKENNLEKACLVHKEQCIFWPQLGKTYNSNKNFILQLSCLSGQNVIVINNPSPDFEKKELQDPNLDVRSIHLIRDGRAILASFLRKYPDKSFSEGLFEWFNPAFQSFYFDKQSNDILCLRYEDLLNDPQTGLVKIARFTGVDYGTDNLEYWKKEQHLTSGNQGTISLIQFASGLDVGNYKDRDFYEDQFRKMQSAGPESFADVRWKTELSREKLFLFDLVCGEQSEKFGYSRDKFQLDEIAEFLKILQQANSQHTFLSVALNRLPIKLVEGESGSRGTEADTMSVQSLREKLKPSTVIANGLIITGRQSRKLIAGGLTAIVLLIVGFFIIGLMLGTWFGSG